MVVGARDVGLVYLTENVEQVRVARRFAENFEKNHYVFATAESCTGGKIGGAITDIPGSSHWFEGGFITYSNKAKMQVLGVKAETLEKYGAVSVQVASEMAEGALIKANVDMTVAVTGIAGPDGGSDEKPVGTVCIGLAKKGEPTYACCYHFSGDRYQVRYSTTMTALLDLLSYAEGDVPEGYAIVE